ncbi:MAG: SDR family oxidoreductase [Sphingomonadales bacterium]|nr:SDR family oxidoreductase [Sphingomonadales bacterium]
MGTNDFAGRTALVTGAASGIGAACAQWLDRQGIAELILVDIDEAGIAALGLSCRVRPHIGSVADEALWARVESEGGPLHHAVINAGIADGCPIVSQSFEGWRRMHSVNLDGAFLSLRAALRLMTQTKGERSVVLTSSTAGVKPLAGTSAYGSTKAAIAHLAKIAALEHADIRVNAIAPGRVQTPIWTKTAQFRALVAQHGSEDAAMAALVADVSVSERVAQADDMAAQIGFLLSDAAWTITGQVVVSDCGYRG